MMGRRIVIGDVHGCFQELEDLLDEIRPTSKDILFQVGDLVNRGPDSHRTIALARQNGIHCLMGNHERRLLRYYRDRNPSILKQFDHATVNQLDADDWRFLEAMPLYYHEEYMQTVLVHAGFLPDPPHPWKAQSPDVVVEIQVIDKEGRPARRSQAPDGRPWGDVWKGPPFVIYGHTPRASVYRSTWALGIDTSCVYGGNLTAVILPGLRIVQVPARQNYAGAVDSD